MLGGRHGQRQRSAPRPARCSREDSRRGERRIKTERRKRKSTDHGAKATARGASRYLPHRDVRLPDERSRLRAHGRPARAGWLRADADEPPTRTSWSSTPAASASAPRRSSSRASARLRAMAARDRATTRSSPSPAASRSRKARRFSSAHQASPTSSSARRPSEALPMLVDAGRARSDGPSIDLNPYEDVTFPLGRRAPQRSRQGLRHDHRGLQRVLQLLRRAVHARPRADAAGGGHLAEVRQAAATGRREVQLLGQIVNHYQAPDDPACDFAGLLEARSRRRRHRADPLRESAPSARHDRASSTRCARSRRSAATCTCRCSRARRASSRRCGALYARELPRVWSAGSATSVPGRRAVDRHDRRVSRARPTRDFEDTLSLTETVRFHSMFSFKYSPRPNTLADKRLRRRRDRRRRRRAASSHCRRCSGQIQSELNDRPRWARPSTC